MGWKQDGWPLATLPESVTRPSREVLDECVEALR
jgi:hypothetical protein